MNIGSLNTGQWLTCHLSVSFQSFVGYLAGTLLLVGCNTLYNSPEIWSICILLGITFPRTLRTMQMYVRKYGKIEFLGRGPLNNHHTK